MQWGTDGLLAWLTITFISITSQEKVMWIDWEKCDTIQANSIQAIVAAAITGNVANHIEAIPCSPQTIDSVLPSIPDTPIVSKAITQSSRWGHLTHLESGMSVLKTVSKLDVSSHLGLTLILH